LAFALRRVTMASTVSLALRASAQQSSAEFDAPRPAPPLFDSVFLGGFECSSHRLEDGRRLDLTASTQHEQFARQDYARLRSLGMHGARDGVNWVRTERHAGSFDFSRARRLFQAAAANQVQVIWDLMHFGWPDHVDVFSTTFADRMARYARAFTRFLAEEGEREPLIVPINEISYLSWAGGDVRCMNPFAVARGDELKAQFVRASIHAMEAIWDVLPGARFMQPEPLINIAASPEHPKTWRRVECDNEYQYQAWDMLCGDVWPALGGAPKYLDLVGVNYYCDNQFLIDGTTVPRGDARYRDFSELLLATWQRYRRPMLIAETGCEGTERAPWLRYIAEQSRLAMQAGCDLHAITLYPILNHPGWLDDRHCENGLWGYADELGHRPVDLALYEELRIQAPLLEAERAKLTGLRESLQLIHAS
jgi:hypothetical protein